MFRQNCGWSPDFLHCIPPMFCIMNCCYIHSKSICLPFMWSLIVSMLVLLHNPYLYFGWVEYCYLCHYTCLDLFIILCFLIYPDLYQQVITATPRQIESLIRLSEALARIRFSELVGETCLVWKHRMVYHECNCYIFLIVFAGGEERCYGGFSSFGSCIATVCNRSLHW